MVIIKMGALIQQDDYDSRLQELTEQCRGGVMLLTTYETLLYADGEIDSGNYLETSEGVTACPIRSEGVTCCGNLGACK